MSIFGDFNNCSLTSNNERLFFTPHDFKLLLIFVFRY